MILLKIKLAFASGLNKSGFIDWFGTLISTYIIHFSPLAAIVLLLCIYYVLHYFFASNTAHAAALLPIFLGAAAHVSGINIHHYVLLILRLAFYFSTLGSVDCINFKFYYLCL